MQFLLLSILINNNIFPKCGTLSSAHHSSFFKHIFLALNKGSFNWSRIKIAKCCFDLRKVCQNQSFCRVEVSAQRISKSCSAEFWPCYYACFCVMWVPVFFLQSDNVDDAPEDEVRVSDSSEETHPDKLRAGGVNDDSRQAWSCDCAAHQAGFWLKSGR